MSVLSAPSTSWSHVCRITYCYLHCTLHITTSAAQCSVNMPGMQCPAIAESPERASINAYIRAAMVAATTLLLLHPCRQKPLHAIRLSSSTRPLHSCTLCLAVQRHLVIPRLHI
jgi:hypothetical protein